MDVDSFAAVSVLYDMFIKATFRDHPELRPFCPYYQLLESYRNIADRIFHTTILNVGFVPELIPERLNVIQKKITQLATGKGDLFLEEDSILEAYVARFWNQILASKLLISWGNPRLQT